MGKLDQYREMIENKLREVLDLAAHAPGTRQVRDQLVIDRVHDNYLIFQEGWHGSRRVHRFLVHLEIRDGKICIHEDWTEGGVARELEAAGVPKSDIVLSFHPPAVRPLTGYAAA